jgi:M6 family metalloprotease-like protein
MNKLLSGLILVFTLAVFAEKTLAVPAYPGQIIVEQPDGSMLKVRLMGDEKVKWALSEDGYTLLRNKAGFFEYAVKDNQKNLVLSGVRAKNLSKRTHNEEGFLSSLKKGLYYSPNQIATLNSIWAIKSSEAQKAFPTTGSRKLICILMGYADLAFTKTQADFDNLFNQVGYNLDGATGSVKDYYLENSYGQLDLTVDIAGPYTANQNLAYYGANDGDGYDEHPRTLVTEAVYQANADVDFSNYDNDNDGSVDGIYVIFAGYGEEAGASADAIWSHAWSISTVTLDGVDISRYSCSPELRGNSGTGLTRIGVIAHEFGHVLGAPDYYDTDNSGTGGDFSGTGQWDMMAGGSWNNGGATPANHNAYTKVFYYNWASATELSAETLGLVMYCAEDSTNSFYMYNTPTTNEFFLMEVRVQKDFDAYIPGEGLLIYHVHSDIASAANSNIINTGHPQMMYPVCASALSDPGSSPSSYGSINSAGCPFPGSSSNTSFTDATIPSSLSWAAENTGKPITNIVFDGVANTVTLDFMADIGDDCSNPILLSGLTGDVDFNTTGNTDDYSGSCGGSGSADIVFQVTTNIDNGGSIQFNTHDEDFDMILYARYGSCTGTEIACIDDPDGTVSIWENTTGSSQQVWIIADGNAGAEGNGSLTWSIDPGPIVGDDCDLPVELSGTSGSIDYTTVDATNDFVSDDCGGNAPDLVFHLGEVVPAGNTLDFWTTDDNYDVLLHARMDSCDGEEIVCMDDPDGSIVNWVNNTGEDKEIWIFADGYSTYTGTATLHWDIYNEALEGDNCDNAVILSGLSGIESFSTASYRDDYQGGCGGNSSDRVYLLGDMVEAGESLDLWTVGADYDIVLYANSDSCNGPEIICNGNPNLIRSTWQNTTGLNKFVWVYLDGNNNEYGEGDFYWSIYADYTAVNDIPGNYLQVYPNPASTVVNIKSMAGNELVIEHINIYNSFGSKVYEYFPKENLQSELEIDVSELTQGTYFIDIKTNNNMIRKNLSIIR